MSTPIFRKKVVAVGYQPLVADATLVFTGEISCPPGNAGNVNFLGDDGNDVPWIPGEFHFFSGVDLALIQVKGTASDLVMMEGNSK